MPYTYTSLALVWLIGAVLVGLTASGKVTGVGVLLLVILALVAPLVLRKPSR